MVANAATNVDSKFPADGMRHVVILWGGTNDVLTGISTTTTYNNIKTYGNARKAAGELVIVFTLQPMGSSASYETSRQALNTLLRADFPTTTAYTNILTGASYADYLVDLGNDATLGVAGAQNDLTYYQSDKVHMTNAGYAIVAALVKNAFLLLLP
jgi:lysophospholipase L1-like esterase